MVSSRERVQRTRIRQEAEGYLELGMPQHALDALARLGDPARFDSPALLLWGEALRAMERYHEALIPLVQAAEVEPENVHVWFALGWCYKRTGRLDLAIDSLQKALLAEPTEGLVYYNLACYWSLAGERRKALNYLAQALTMVPGFRDLIDDESDFDPIRCDHEFQVLRNGTRVPSRAKRKRRSSPKSPEREP